MIKKRIALISFHTCPFLPPGSGKVGGMNVYINQLSKKISRHGLGIDIFTREHQGVPCNVETSESFVRVFHLYGGELDIPVTDLYSYLPEFINGIRSVVKDNKMKYDLVHSHYWLSGWAGQMLTRDWDVPHVVNFHTLGAVKRRSIHGETENRERYDVEKELMHSAEMIICSSEDEQQDMMRLYGASKHNIEVIQPGVDLDLFKPTYDSGPTVDLVENVPIVLFVGRIERLKGLEVLLHAISLGEMKHCCRLIIVGGDPTDDEFIRIKGLCSKLGLSNDVMFCGRVNQSDLPHYYSVADVLVVPSYHETFGMVALEAMACETPVIAARVGGLKTLIKHGQTGYLIPSQCPDLYAKYMETMILNTQLRHSMGKQSRLLAETMGWGNVADKITKLYDSLN
jgi:D-inositol-3-phosphate glycosyltransferase